MPAISSMANSRIRLHAVPVALPVPLPTPTEVLMAVSLKEQMIIVVRLVWAGLAGSILGLERSRRRGRAAYVGPRTMSLVSIGAGLFTVSGVFGPGGDPTRLAAAAASGVGFIGAGVISRGSGNTPVDGLTTAASIWCAAALGVASGVGLGLVSTMCTVIAVTVLESTHIYSRFQRKRIQMQRHRRDSTPLS